MNAGTDRTAAVASGAAAPSVRRSAWVAGWRLALRLNRREARRNRFGTWLVALLVGVPVLLITAGATYLTTSTPSEDERDGLTMGQAQVAFRLGSERTSLGNEGYDPGLAKTVPGQRAPGVWTISQLQQTLGGTVYPLPRGTGYAQLNSGPATLRVLAVDPAQPVFRGMLDLVSGRWPGPGEVVVGQSRGVAPGSTLSLRIDGRTATVIVVGILVNGSEDVVGLPGTLGISPTIADGTLRMSNQLLLQRATPITADELRNWAALGLSLEGKLVRDQFGMIGADLSLAIVFLAVPVAAGLFLEVALLTAPAFAVGANRARRTLALAAANGATRVQLRRIVLGQAVVLGWLPAILAGIGGVAVGVASYLVIAARDPGDRHWPIEIPWWEVTLVVACTMASTLAAALWPARGLRRLDVVNVLRGQPPAARPSRRVPIIGLVVIPLSLAMLTVAALLGVRNDAGGAGVAFGLLLTFGVLGMMLGILAFVPTMLS